MKLHAGIRVICIAVVAAVIGTGLVAFGGSAITHIPDFSRVWSSGYDAFLVIGFVSFPATLVIGLPVTILIYRDAKRAPVWLIGTIIGVAVSMALALMAYVSGDNEIAPPSWILTNGAMCGFLIGLFADLLVRLAKK
jgi:putative copper export protein